MKSSQFNIKLGHNCIKALIKPIEPPCTKHADHRLKEGDQLQDGLNMNMKAWQEQEETQGSLPANIRQNKRLFPGQQATEQQRHRPAWQPTLRALERLAWCVYEHGISKNGIFRHERRSQDSELARRVLTEPTRTATRSSVRLIFDNG